MKDFKFTISNNEELVKRIISCPIDYKEYRAKFPEDAIDVRISGDEIMYAASTATEWVTAGYECDDAEWFHDVVAQLAPYNVKEETK